VTEADIDRVEMSGVPSPPRSRGGGRLVAGLTFLVGVVPVAAAVVAVRRPRWYPEMDLAMTELLVRDVGSRHPPLVGLIGRIYGLGGRGHHPGPLSFWLLAPVYRLFGSTAWSLQVATAALNVAAMAAAIWIGHRRGGRAGAVGVAGMVAVLELRYGTGTLTQPWNPYIPLLWWFVLLLAVWSVVCTDLAMLPVAVFAGSLCVQTHVSYLGLVAGLAGLVTAALAVQSWRRRGDRGHRRRVGRWVLGSLALLALLWSAPLAQQVRARRGGGQREPDPVPRPAAGRPHRVPGHRGGAARGRPLARATGRGRARLRRLSGRGPDRGVHERRLIPRSVR
jgi:hypothetical protein